MIGETIGTYEVVGEIGRGGMGAVYRARHTLLGRVAALKVLLPEVSSHTDVVERFFNEAKATTGIRHPGIVEVYDFGYHTDGSAFIVMELLEGESLLDRLARVGRLPADEALTLARQTASALGAAHAQQIVHRDLKPDNVFICPDADFPGGERVKILDFGIAKLGGEKIGAGSVKTQAGLIMGTPAYMSPEQCKGASEVDRRSDLYALGCLFFEMLCGRAPFVADGAGELLAMHITEPPPDPREFEPSVPPEVAAIVNQLLAKDPDERFATAKAVKRAIDQARGGHAMDSHSGSARAGTESEQPVAFAAPSSVSSPETGERAHVSMAPTTLRHASGAVPVQKERGGIYRWMAPAAGVAVCAAAAAIYFGRSGAVDEGDESDVGAIAATTEIPAPKRSMPVAATPVADAAPPANVEITIVTEPPGASVYRMPTGVRVGKTPHTSTMPPSEGDLIFLLQLDGYKDYSLEVAANQSYSEPIVLAPDVTDKRRSAKERARVRRESRRRVAKRTKREARKQQASEPTPLLKKKALNPFEKQRRSKSRALNPFE